MIETNSAQFDSHTSESEPGRDILERAEKLQRKVGDLSKAIDQIRQNLAEAAGESEDEAN